MLRASPRPPELEASDRARRANASTARLSRDTRRARTRRCASKVPSAAVSRSETSRRLPDPRTTPSTSNAAPLAVELARTSSPARSSRRTTR